MIDDSKNFQLINMLFPHVGTKLKLSWGQADFIELIDDLFQDKRGGERHGFSEEVLFALQNLESEHGDEFPELSRKSGIWGL
jgi:hypothetical protein